MQALDNSAILKTRLLKISVASVLVPLLSFSNTRVAIIGFWCLKRL